MGTNMHFSHLTSILALAAIGSTHSAPTTGSATAAAVGTTAPKPPRTLMIAGVQKPTNEVLMLYQKSIPKAIASENYSTVVIGDADGLDRTAQSILIQLKQKHSFKLIVVDKKLKDVEDVKLKGYEKKDSEGNELTKEDQGIDLAKKKAKHVQDIEAQKKRKQDLGLLGISYITEGDSFLARDTILLENSTDVLVFVDTIHDFGASSTWSLIIDYIRHQHQDVELKTEKAHGYLEEMKGLRVDESEFYKQGSDKMKGILSKIFEDSESKSAVQDCLDFLADHTVPKSKFDKMLELIGNTSVENSEKLEKVEK